VTPHLVRPVRAANLKSPTDRVGPPAEADLFLLGRTDTGIAPATEFTQPPVLTPPPVVVAPPVPGGSAQNKPIGLEKDYGHVL